LALQSWQLLTSVQGHAEFEKLKQFVPDRHPLHIKLESILIVEVISARGLRAADGSRLDGLYCVVEIPGKQHSKFKTGIIQQNRNPVWNNTGILSDFGLGDMVVFNIWDEGWSIDNDFYGKLTMTYAMCANGFEGEMPLSEAGDGVQAYIKIRIESIC